MFLKIKNNPKKTIFFSGVFCYAYYYAYDKYKQNEIRREICNNTKKLGDAFIHPLKELTRVTVIHNPRANNGKSSGLFKDNIYPLLNLSGYKVTVIETEKAEEAKELMSVLKPDDQDCIFIAGGDGTLLEITTGLLRRSDLRDHMHKIPLILAPLGKWNSFVHRWIPIKTDNIIKTCSNAVSLIEQNKIKPSNALLVRSVVEEGETNQSPCDVIKPKEIYALSGLDWSVDRDVFKKGKGKWIFGPYRHHAQYVISGMFGKHLSTNKTATLLYREKCNGCNKCTCNELSSPYQQSSHGILRSFLRFMLPMYFKETIAKEREKSLKYDEKSKIVNLNCGVVQTKKVTDVRGFSVVLDEDQLKVKIRNSEPDFVNYVKSGIKALKDIPYLENGGTDEMFACTDLKIIPETNSVEKFYVDNEELDVVPLELTVLKNVLYFYT